jgi:hypothetical protein
MLDDDILHNVVGEKTKSERTKRLDVHARTGGGANADESAVHLGASFRTETLLPRLPRGVDKFANNKIIFCLSKTNKQTNKKNNK